jgi:predicted protein tyrosine phosphatase
MFGPKYTGAVDRAKARGVDFLNLDWVDHKDFRITTERMVESLLYIHRALAGGSSVVVHCAQGKSRSSTVVVAYVAAFVAPSAKAAGETALDFALRAVQSRRKMAAPNPGFMVQLREWETEGLWTQVRATSCEGAGADAGSTTGRHLRMEHAADGQLEVPGAEAHESDQIRKESNLISELERQLEEQRTGAKCRISAQCSELEDDQRVIWLLRPIAPFPRAMPEHKLPVVGNRSSSRRSNGKTVGCIRAAEGSPDQSPRGGAHISQACRLPRIIANR